MTFLEMFGDGAIDDGIFIKIPLINLGITASQESLVIPAILLRVNLFFESVLSDKEGNILSFPNRTKVGSKKKLTEANCIFSHLIFEPDKTIYVYHFMFFKENV